MAYSFNRNNGFNNVPALPVDGYVCKIIAAPRYERWDDAANKYVEVSNFETADRTVVPFDIVEGPQTGYFQKRFDTDESAEKKWKGSLVLRHPTDKDQYDTNERRYNSFGAALMDSNPAFDFDINKNAACKGLLIGIVFRSHSYKKDNGEVGSYAEAYSTYSVDAIRSKDFKIPKAYVDKSITSNPNPTDNGFVQVNDNAPEEIPF